MMPKATSLLPVATACLLALAAPAASAKNCGAVLPAGQDICVAENGAVQSASQIVLDGRDATTQPVIAAFPLDDPSTGPDPEEYPKDYV